MTVAYLDASTVVKVLKHEEGSAEAQALWRRISRAHASRLTGIEVRAALAAAHRNRRLTDLELAVALEREHRVSSGIVVIELDPSVEVIARSVAVRHGLKGADAVHLASALALEEPELVFATWDRRLHAAAMAEGLAVAPASL